MQIRAEWDFSQITPKEMRELARSLIGKPLTNGFDGPVIGRVMAAWVTGDGKKIAWEGEIEV